MKAHEFEWLVDLVADEEDGLRAVTQKHLAEKVVLALVRGGHPLADVLARAAHSPFADHLLERVIEAVANTARRRELVTALIGLPDKYWSDSWECEDFGFPAPPWRFDDPEDFEWMLAHHPEIMRNCEHPLHNAFNADAYWMKRVRRHIVRKDFVRAFDEFKKAFRGFYVNDRPPLARDLRAPGYRDARQWQSADAYKYGASPPTLRTLIRELHDAMVAAKLIAPVPEGPFTLTADEATVEVKRYQTRVPRDGRRPAVSTVPVPRAGKVIADALFLRSTEKGPGPYGYGERVTAWTYDREGGMILAVAEWWRTRKQARQDAARRRKYERALAEYENARKET
jgi:hypothetical protein